MKNTILLSLFFAFLAQGTFCQESEQWNQKNEQGQRIGKWRDYHSSGKLRYEGQFDQGMPFDVFKYYFQSGNVQTVLTYENSSVANGEHYYENGDLMAKGKYIDRQKEGIWVTYGDKEVIVEKGSYLAGKKYGAWKTFYPSGKIAEEIVLENDLEEGPLRVYFDDGTLKQEATYSKGFLEGRSVFYNPEGKKILSGNYYKSSRDGDWIYFDDSLNIENVLKYDKGKLLNPEAEELIEDDADLFKDNVKDELEFEDLKGKIKYEKSE
jgi:antitoxin component YwqK of YwqJK toxin-antitoxin module